MKRLLAILLLALADLVTGWLGLRLAIPPGYATAVFPPAGIALAALYVFGNGLWPGVFLGSLALNVVLGLSGVLAQPVHALAVAAGIASGSTLQACVGAGLLRRFVGSPTTLDDERSIGRFFLIGPASCGIAALWGTAALALGGLAGPEPAFTAFTWWVGDTLGVLIFTPLVLCAFASPAAIWRPRLRALGVPMAVAASGVVVLFVYASGREQAHAELRLEHRVDGHARTLWREIDHHIEAVRAVASLFTAETDVTREEFATFALTLEPGFRGIRALEWVPRVAPDARPSLEEALGLPIRHWTGGEWRAAADAPAGESFPVLYAAPEQTNRAVLGIDLASHPERRAALERARDSGQPVATGGVTLAQDDGGGGFLVFAPVYRGGAPGSLDERRASLAGFGLGVFRMDDIVAAVLPGASGNALEIVDATAADAPHALFGARTDAGGLFHEYARDVAGRAWRLRFYAQPGDLARSWEPWSFLACGLLFTALLGSFLLFVSGRSRHVEELVRLRTRELAATAAELERSNRELDSFAHVASHDLKAPLRAIMSLAQWIEEDAGHVLPEEAREQLGTLQRRVTRMAKLLDDLLAYSRVARTPHRTEVVDLRELVADIWRLEAAPPDFEIVLPDGLPPLRTERAPLEQVLRNLVNNAVKHHDREAGHVEVGARLDGDGLEIRVCDDGPGIAPEDQDRVLRMFTTLRPRDQVEGSGMGLAIASKSVERQGGQLRIESDGKRGTCLCFRWPATPAPARAG